MSFYYKRPMGNGTMATKFRLGSVVHAESSVRSGDNMDGISDHHEKNSENNELASSNLTDKTASHFANSCNRCYRLKKKCSREVPKCSNCSRLGSDCEYEDRRVKRRRTEREDAGTGRTSHSEKFEGVLVTQNGKASRNLVIEEFHGANAASGMTKNHEQNTIDDTDDTDATHESATSTNTPPSSDKNVRPARFDQSRLSVLSLLSGERPQLGTRLSHRALLAKRSAVRALHPPTPMNLREEYITMDSVPEEKAHTFANSFFVNYGTKYPFISQKRFFSWFSRIKFDQEAIVNLDGYLVMAIGLLIHDANSKGTTFSSYFSEKIIDSIVDIIDFDMSQSLDLENVRLLLLLGIYSLHMFQYDLCWSIVGALDRVALQLDLYRTSDALPLRLFWSIYNFDKELSILRNKPSQIPSDHYISLPFPLTESLHPPEPDNNLDVVNQEIGYFKLVDRLLYFKLTTDSNRGSDEYKEGLKCLASDLEKWRSATSRTIHTRYCDSPMLQHHISQVNIKYYYLFVEMDQVSDSQLSQFTLQFLLNSFTLLISENNKNCGLSLHNLFWYQLLFRVTKYLLGSLPVILASGSSRELGFADFNNNLQLVVNIVKFSSQKSGQYAAKVNQFQERLADFAMLLMRTDVSGSVEELVRKQGEIGAEVERLL